LRWDKTPLEHLFSQPKQETSWLIILFPMLAASLGKQIIV